MEHDEKTAKHGYTMIELIVVLAVVGILLVLSILAVGSTRQRSRDVLRLAAMKEIYFGLELYFNANSDYPEGDKVELGASQAQCLDDEGFHPQGGCSGNVWLTNVLKNPTPGGTPFLYVYDSGPPSSYAILFSLEGKAGGLSEGEHIMTPSGIQ